jgi:hypothetical protein
VPSEELLDDDFFIEELVVVVEYPSFFGSSVLIKLKVPEILLEQIKKSFNEWSKKISNK